MFGFELPFFSRPLWTLIAVFLIAAVIAYFARGKRRRREMRDEVGGARDE